MKTLFAVNPQFASSAVSSVAPSRFATLADLLAFHAESHRIGLGYIAAKLGISEEAAREQCVEAGLEIEETEVL